MRSIVVVVGEFERRYRHPAAPNLGLRPAGRVSPEKTDSDRHRFATRKASPTRAATASLSGAAPTIALHSHTVSVISRAWEAEGPAIVSVSGGLCRARSSRGLSTSGTNPGARSDWFSFPGPAVATRHPETDPPGDRKPSLVSPGAVP